MELLDEANTYTMDNKKVYIAIEDTVNIFMPMTA